MSEQQLFAGMGSLSGLMNEKPIVDLSWLEIVPGSYDNIPSHNNPHDVIPQLQEAWSLENHATPTSFIPNQVLSGKAEIQEIGPEKIGLIAAHGTGVAAEDIAEVSEWRKAMGSVADSIPAFAITGSTGSMFAGAGGVQLALVAMAMQTQTAPPTVNLRKTAAGCEMSFSAQARPAKIDYAIAASYTVGGQSGACVLKRYEN